MVSLSTAQFNGILSAFRHPQPGDNRRRFGVDSMQCWDIAAALGLSYTGDASLEHGGMFYDPSDWAEYGYCQALEVAITENRVYVTGGTVSKPSKLEDLQSALQCIGASRLPNGDIDNNGELLSAGSTSAIHCEIYACQAYRGIEQDEFASKAYPLISNPMGSDVFKVGPDRFVSMDSLQGFIVREHLPGSVLSIG